MINSHDSILLHISIYISICLRSVKYTIVNLHAISLVFTYVLAREMVYSTITVIIIVLLLSAPTRMLSERVNFRRVVRDAWRSPGETSTRRAGNELPARTQSHYGTDMLACVQYTYYICTLYSVVATSSVCQINAIVKFCNRKESSTFTQSHGPFALVFYDANVFFAYIMYMHSRSQDVIRVLCSE